jgi:hypothetical protein
MPRIEAGIFFGGRLCLPCAGFKDTGPKPPATIRDIYSQKRRGMTAIADDLHKPVLWTVQVSALGRKRTSPLCANGRHVLGKPYLSWEWSTLLTKEA